MQTYITQLLEQLQAAKSRRPSPRHLVLRIEEEGLEDIVDLEIAIQEEGATMEELFGIPQSAFPAVEQLTNQQMEQLVAAILDLWLVFRYQAELPENLPARYAYPALIARWTEKQPVSRANYGMWHLEFCDGEPDECPFPKEYCRCTHFEEDEASPQ